MKIGLKGTIVIAILGPVLVGCVSRGVDTTVAVTNVPSESVGYPAPEGNGITIVPYENGYPYETENQEIESELPSELIVPTPSVNKVVFWGQMLTSGSGGTPYVGSLYLGYLIQANQVGYPPLIKFSEDTNPKAVVDKEGHFYFSDVDPGEYALVIYSPGGVYFFKDDAGETMYIKGSAGKVVDLGIIDVP